MRAVVGDNEAFRVLYEQANGIMTRAIRRVLKYHPEEVEDTLQDTWLKLFRKAKGFRGEAKFSTWACISAKREALMVLRLGRLKRVGAHVSLDQDEFTSKGTRRVSLAEQLGAPDREQESLPVRLAVHQAVAKLAPKQRQIMELHGLEGREHREMVKMLHIHMGTTKSQYHKACENLKCLLQGGKIPAHGPNLKRIAGRKALAASSSLGG